MPEAPVLHAGFREVLWLTPDGEIAALAREEARRRIEEATPMLCHLRATARRLDLPLFPALDLLELFAFVHPARFCVPTPRGLAEALGLVPPRCAADACVVLLGAARTLLETLAADSDPEARAIAAAMARGGWPWGPAVLAALPEAAPDALKRASGLRAWTTLPEWPESAPAPPAGHAPVTPDEARTRLAALLGDGAEPRPTQADYAAAVTAAFLPRAEPDRPHAILAEAGTGVGKTLGYLAPASLWAERNGGSVWISTYTRNLQSQIAAELDRLYPDPDDKRRQVAIRKGRENFLCLLNYEEAVGTAAGRGRAAAQLGLIARWIAATEAGDIMAGDFPGWLAELIGRGRTGGLADRRGECIHSACPHFRRCFVEKNIRKARHARIVVANHALVMAQAALGGLDDATVPTRYVFDEGHHLLDAAAAAFAVRLSGHEGRELRRWIVGAELLGSSGGRSRARGLRRRIGDLVETDEAGEKALFEALAAARVLPAEGWGGRAVEDHPLSDFERFLALARQQVLARATLGPRGGGDAGYGLEVEARPPIEGLAEAALALAKGLERLAAALAALATALRRRLEDPESPPDPTLRQRLDAAIRGLDRRGAMQIGAWCQLLRDLDAPVQPETVEWLALDRSDGIETDVALNRGWIDPGIPFARLVAMPAHGVVVTSATLTDGAADPERAFAAAEMTTGLRHLPHRPLAAQIASPFDYAAQTRVLIVTDIPRDDPGQLAAAYAALFAAAKGGALGLFTAIARLKAVHERIAPVLEARGIPLLAQHVEAMSTATLVDIFRAEEDSCLLGTDAVRDGVDVPGRSLRLIVFDRVPWPRPDILHRAKKPVFGGAQYEDRITRGRLRQAYGRLIRRANDRGVFAILDRALPSRLLAAFPEGVPIARVPLAAAVEATAHFLDSAPAG
ncbi:MAG: ATP-dependent DNA helicase [Stellaceae bacterium]